MSWVGWGLDEEEMDTTPEFHDVRWTNHVTGPPALCCCAAGTDGPTDLGLVVEARVIALVQPPEVLPRVGRLRVGPQLLLGRLWVDGWMRGSNEAM